MNKRNDQQSRRLGLRLSLAALAAASCANAIAATNVYTTSDAPVAIPDDTNAYDTCQNISVPSTGTDTINSLTVQMDINHTFVNDLAIELRSPAGTKLTLMHKPGNGITGSFSDDLLAGTPITFDDTAPTPAEAMGMDALGCLGTISSPCPTIYKPDPNKFGSGFTTAPLSTSGVDTLADFAGQNANGTWKLCVADTTGADTGSLNSWSLTVKTPDPVKASVDNAALYGLSTLALGAFGIRSLRRRQALRSTQNA